MQFNITKKELLRALKYARTYSASEHRTVTLRHTPSPVLGKLEVGIQGKNFKDITEVDSA